MSANLISEGEGFAAAFIKRVLIVLSAGAIGHGVWIKMSWQIRTLSTIFWTNLLFSAY